MHPVLFPFLVTQVICVYLVLTFMTKIFFMILMSPTNLTLRCLWSLWVLRVDLVLTKRRLGSMTPLGKPVRHNLGFGQTDIRKWKTLRKWRFRAGKPWSQFSHCLLPFRMQVQSQSQMLVLSRISLRGI